MATCIMIQLGQSFASLNLHTISRTILIRSATSVKYSLYDKLGLPEKPKRPPTTFIAFFNNVKPDLLKKYPNSKQSDLIKKASQLWEKTSPEEKQKLNETYKEEFEKYKVSLEKYNNSLTFQQKLEIKEAQAEIKAIRDNKKAILIKEKRKKLLEKPKKPLNGFLKYLASKKEAMRGEPQQLFFKKVAEEWKSIPESTKKQMKEEYDKEYENYIHELNKWEEKMIKEGNVDVVRLKTLRGKLQVYS